MPRMPKSPEFAGFRWHVSATAMVLIAANCAPLPPTSSAAIPSMAAGDARLWFYRDGGPHDAHQRPYLRLNGQIAGISEPNGAFYRDVEPGHYSVTVDSYVGFNFNQFTEIDLAAGQEAYVKILSQGMYVGGERAARENFYTRVIPAEVARADATRRLFYGGS
jgi:Protein of unknown function (DUF2846)